MVDNMSHAENVGGLFRLSDALGIEKLYLCGDTPVPPNARIKKTARATEQYVDYSYHDDPESLARELQDGGTLIVALEITSTSVDISADEFRRKINGHRVCLVLGAENTGISDTLLELADITVHIPMAGRNSSMNVISAASIACYEIIKTV